MRSWLVAILLLAPLAATPHAAASENDVARYTGSAGVLVEGVDFTALSGACPFHENLAYGGVYPDEELQETYGCVSVAFGNAESGDLYQIVEIAVTDDWSGTNVYSGVCILGSDDAPRCDDGQADDVADAYAQGCGISVTADATGIHAGNDDAFGFVFTAYADPTTNVVCLATAGEANFIFVS